MKEYSETVRARMVARLLGPYAVSAAALSKETGISQATLSRWLKAAAIIDPVVSKRKKRQHPAEPAVVSERPAASTTRRTGADKLGLLERAAGLEGEALGAFLRGEGVHLAELEQWRTRAREALHGSSKRVAPSKELRRLQAELRRKEKALAETAALIVLKKKVKEIWGDEDDDMESFNAS
jgi:transposase-like protein